MQYIIVLLKQQRNIGSFPEKSIGPFDTKEEAESFWQNYYWEQQMIGCDGYSIIPVEQPPKGF